MDLHIQKLDRIYSQSSFHYDVYIRDNLQTFKTKNLPSSLNSQLSDGEQVFIDINEMWFKYTEIHGRQYIQGTFQHVSMLILALLRKTVC